MSYNKTLMALALGLALTAIQQREPAYEWRHWQPRSKVGKKGRYGAWKPCTRLEYERTDNNYGTQKRIKGQTP